MNGIKHHISDDLLMGYAAGALPQAFDLVVASHVSLSDDARALAMETIIDSAIFLTKPSFIDSLRLNLAATP